MKKKIGIIALALAVISLGGWWLFGQTNESISNRENTFQQENKANSMLAAREDGKHTVLDCRDEGSCGMSIIKTRYTIDSDPDIGTGCSQAAYSPGDPQECESLTMENLEEIGMLADASNYINIPLDRERNFIDSRLDVELIHPWDIEFLPDGRALVTERLGAIKLLSASLDSEKIIADTNPVQIGETGLLGLAIDPLFTDNAYVYTYNTYAITHEAPTVRETIVANRVVRWTFIGEELRQDKIILEKIPGSGWHSGGRLEFGPDGYLYITTGDANDPFQSQSISSLAGKVLRITRDGDPVVGNEDNSLVYSKGYRNPQGLAWADDGTLFISGHGPKRYDEINKISQAGQNGGWGTFYCNEIPDSWEGRTPLSKTTSPEICYDYYTMAPSGMLIVTDSSSPWSGNLFIAGLRGRHIQRIPLDASTLTGGGDIFFTTETGHRLRDIKHYNGNLYVLGDEEGLWRLTPQ